VLYDNSRPDPSESAPNAPASQQFLLQLTRWSTLTLDMLTAVLARALDAQSPARPDTGRSALMAQIYAFIQKNLGDANLTVSAVAAAHHISLRYLHKLFQQDGHTVAGWIRERRLEQCRRDLINPHLAARPINAIAARWGFTSPAHFSQAFRNVYGLSPRQYRRQCTTAHTPKPCAFTLPQ
jgi:AraC-like DNA-binding protein